MNSKIDSLVDALLARPLTIVAFAFCAAAGGFFAQICIPAMFASSNGAQAYLAPPAPLALAGQEVYFQEGCQYCHSQGLRPFAWETARFANAEAYGRAPLADATEYQFESPLVRGSKRLGPDLSRLAGRFDEAALTALLQSKAEGKNFKADIHPYAHLFASDSELYPLFLSWKVRAMINGGVLFSDPYQKSVFLELEDKTRGEALVQYLLSRGRKQVDFAGNFYK